MKFSNIPKITKRIELAEYHESFAGQVVDVWVNPPRAVKQERERLVREYAVLSVQLVTQKRVTPQKNSVSAFLESFLERAKGTHQQRTDALFNRMNAWFLMIWNAGEDPQWHWTADELQQLYDADPALYGWLTTRTITLMEEWRTEQKKT